MSVTSETVDNCGEVMDYQLRKYGSSNNGRQKLTVSNLLIRQPYLSRWTSSWHLQLQIYHLANAPRHSDHCAERSNRGPFEVLRFRLLVKGEWS